MTKQSFFISAAFLIFVGSSTEPNWASAQGKPAPGWTLEKPDDVKVPIGGTGYLTVTIKRKGYKGPVKVELQDLPQGIQVKEKKKTIGESEGKADFILIGSGDLKEEKLKGAKVVATAEGITQSKDFVIDVKDFSLESTSGLVMGISVIAVLGLVTFCVWRVFTLPPVEVEEHLKGPLEIDTRDTLDAD